MKICLVSDTLPNCHDFWGGSEIIAWKLGEILEKNGQQVIFLTTRFRKKITVKNIFQIPTKNFSKIGSFFPFFSINFPIDIFSIFYSIIILKKTKPDVIHFHNRELFLPVIIASIILKIPTVFTVLEDFLICPKIIATTPDGNICETFSGSNCFKCFLGLNNDYKLNFWKKPRLNIKIEIIKKLSFLRVLIFNHFIKKIDTVLFLTEESKTEMKRRGLIIKKGAVSYLYRLGFRKDIIKNTSSLMNRLTIVFVGSLYPYKGCDVLIQAMPDIISEIPNVKLKIIGSNKKDGIVFQNKISDTIEKLKINKNIEFLGQLKNEEVLEVILKNNLVVIPEQWPNPGPVILLEAMALEKPVVTGDIGSMPEFIKNGFNGFLVEYNNPKQFAEKIIWLLKHGDEAKLMGQRAKESIQFLFNRDQFREVVNIYNEVTGHI